MNPQVEAPRNLVVDRGAKPGQAAEGRLDMSARTAEAVIEIEMAEGGVEVVDPHQANHAAAEPDAFGIAGRAADGLGGLGKFSRLALILLGGVGICGGVLALVLSVGIAALGKGGAAGRQHQHKPGDGEMAQDRILN